MPDIHIHREHHLGFSKARKVAFSWAEQAEEKFDMDCIYEEGDAQDTLYFSRAGVKGTLVVDARQFEMNAQLGFLFGAFKERIEAEIGEQLDALLSAPQSAARKIAADTTAATAGAGADKPEKSAKAQPSKAVAKPASKARKA